MADLLGRPGEILNRRPRYQLPRLLAGGSGFSETAFRLMKNAFQPWTRTAGPADMSKS
jgi:hypothetical protein